MKKRWQLRGTRGQSLVELALALPLLLLMFAGLVEVGYALRNYLVVVNANREGTRFAARGRWFDKPEEWNYIAERLVAAAGTEPQGDPFMRTETLDDMPPNTMIAIHYIEVPDQIDEFGGVEAQEPTIYGPWITGMDCGIFGFECVPLGVDALRDIANKAREENEEFNQKYFVEDGLLEIPSEDNFVIIETWYLHEQLLKLPLFTAAFPEKIPLYARTQMRVTLSRELFGEG